MLPLYVPVLIFGVSAVTPFVSGPHSLWAPFLMLCALSLASIVLAPIAAAAALRNALRKAWVSPVSSCDGHDARHVSEASGQYRYLSGMTISCSVVSTTNIASEPSRLRRAGVGAHLVVVAGTSVRFLLPYRHARARR